ncbi:MAG: hypothetical protein HRT68_16355 [Flavobacteriaceae bacterium]|nr:hypothetical protein [Flavobacteriaceae bacterium]
MTKNLIIISIFSLLIFSCKQAETKEEVPVEEIEETIMSEEPKIQMVFPESIDKLFEAHGGLDRWNALGHLSFRLNKSRSNESYQLNLQTGKSLVQGSDFIIGDDGEYVWLKEYGKPFKSDVRFYSKFHAYFMMMPFVLADENTVFTRAAAVKYQGTLYPGYRVSFREHHENIPVDEYYIHFNPKTYRMEWLGYTMPKKPGSNENKVLMVRYRDLKVVDGVLLPNSLTWHRYRDGVIGSKTNAVRFSDIELSNDPLATELFEMPEGVKAY